eukprot:COSAG06_NODE_19263_length_846_cov_0.945114_1_plen_23_part_10
MAPKSLFPDLQEEHNRNQQTQLL